MSPVSMDKLDFSSFLIINILDIIG